MKDALYNLSLDEYLKELSSKKPTPGGGSAAAYVGALGAGCISMAFLYSEKEKTDVSSRDRYKKLQEAISKIQHELLKATDEDARVFDEFMEASGEEKQVTLTGCANIAVMISHFSFSLYRLVIENSSLFSSSLRSDLVIGLSLLKVSSQMSLINVRINKKGIEDKETVELLDKKTQEVEKGLKGLEDKFFNIFNK